MGRWANVDAAKLINQRVSEIGYATGEHYLLEKVAPLTAWSAILFSARKHRKYGGSANVMQYILQDLGNIENYARRQPAQEGK